MLMNKDSVQWDRQIETGVDALGHATVVSAPGYPQTVRGNFQERRRKAKSEDRTGYHVEVVADFFTDTFLTGKDADVVRFNGLEYKVTEVRTRRSLFGSGVAFKAYALSLNQAGSQQVEA